MDWSTPGFLVLHYLPEFAQTHVHRINDAILYHPLLLLPSIFPSIWVFSNELALHIRWPKYWSFSFSISLSCEYSGLIFFGIDWFDLLAVQGTFKSILEHHCSKASNLWHSVQGNGNPLLAWKIQWTVGPSRLQSMRSKRVGHNWVTSLSSKGQLSHSYMTNGKKLGFD